MKKIIPNFRRQAIMGPLEISSQASESPALPSQESPMVATVPDSAYNRLVQLGLVDLSVKAKYPDQFARRLNQKIWEKYRASS